MIDTLPLPANTAAPAAPVDLVGLLLADKRSEATRRAYRYDLVDFFGGAPSQEQVRQFASLSAPELALRLATYKAEMLARGLKEATVNRRLAALRSLLKLCHRLGLAATDGRGLVDGEKVTPYRDTRGVDVRMLKRLVAAPGTDTLRGARDTAILRLLVENALRRAEVCALNVGDFSLTERRLQVTGKGRGSQKEPITLSRGCAEAIAGYLVAAGHATETTGALFRNLDRRREHAGERLTADGLHFLVRQYGRTLGVGNLTPHRLRHSSITAALDATGGDVRRVQKLSRHRDLRTLTIYDDRRKDDQGDITRKLAELLEDHQ